MATARASGIQPPSGTLSRLAPKNAVSTIRKNPATMPASTTDQPQISRMARKSSTVVSSMVVETAMP